MRLIFSLVLLLIFLISVAAYAQTVNVDSDKAVSCAAHKTDSCRDYCLKSAVGRNYNCRHRCPGCVGRMAKSRQRSRRGCDLHCSYDY